VAEAPRAAPPAPAAQSQAVPETAEPYIDSFLCTSCNDCMKVNPRLFLYNANKQAYLADPSVGTFAELLKAAEGCPARCIHVGTPRPGDATATPALLAKSAKFR
jgi:ferredoxin